MPTRRKASADNPEGWLLAVARNRQKDLYKSSAFSTAAPLEPAADSWSTIDELDVDAIPDKRLSLMFVCAHPAIDPGVRTPMMLQTVLGFESAQIWRRRWNAPMVPTRPWPSSTASTPIRICGRPFSGFSRRGRPVPTC